MHAHLLVAYVVAGAREVLDGKELSGRSRWAIEDAVTQLRAQRVIVDGAADLDETSARFALTPSSRDCSVQFAELVLQSGRTAQHEPATTLEEHERRSSQRLGELIDALERLGEGDAEAARRADDVFRAIIIARAQGDTLADIF